MSKLVQKIDPLTGIEYIGKVKGDELEPGLADARFIFEQTIPSSIWTIQHNLGKFPSVTVVDSANSIVVGEVNYIDLNNLQISFSGAFSGRAYLN